MSDVTVTLTHNIIGQVTDQMRRAVALVVNKTAQDILTTAQASMEGPKSGRSYSRGGKLHIASAPGEPPAVDTGNLRASGYTKKLGDMEWEIGYTADYAEILEGINGSQFDSGGLLDMADMLGVWMAPVQGGVEPRPFLRPAVAAEAEAFYAALQKLGV